MCYIRTTNKRHMSASNSLDAVCIIVNVSSSLDPDHEMVLKCFNHINQRSDIQTSCSAQLYQTQLCKNASLNESSSTFPVIEPDIMANLCSSIKFYLIVIQCKKDILIKYFSAFTIL